MFLDGIWLEFSASEALVRRTKPLPPGHLPHRSLGGLRRVVDGLVDVGAEWCLGVVVGEDAVVIAEVGGVAFFQRCADLGVELEATRGRQLVVESLLDQPVTEAVLSECLS